jgi:hypothetical protein
MDSVSDTTEGGDGRPPVLAMSGIAKAFAGVRALKGVDLDLSTQRRALCRCCRRTR